MNSWYLVKVKYTKEFEDGTLKRVTEPYLINSVSHGDAEERIYVEVGEFIRGEFIVVGVTPYKIADLFQYDDSDVWYKCKVSYVSEDADSGKEKKVNNLFLVSASNVKQAYERIEESMKGLMVTYSIPKVEETDIIDIFPYVSVEEVASEENSQEEE